MRSNETCNPQQKGINDELELIVDKKTCMSTIGN